MNMDRYRIDSHKLIYHVRRVNDWLEGRDTYPVYMEVSPAGGCNHRCIYCGLDFMKYQPRFLDTKIFKETLAEMGRLGVKSIMYAGEGEPFLHRDIIDIIRSTRNAGIDVAFTTNAVLLSKKIIDSALGDIAWIKVSVNGATPGTYSKIHNAPKDDFGKVMENMAYAANVKRKRKLTCALGMQLVLLPENKDEIKLLARTAKKIGMDYLVIKPYSQHPKSDTKKYKDIKYNGYLYLADELKRFNDGRFNVVFRINTMKKWDGAEKGYRRCLALSFWSYIDAGGNLWGCSVYLGDEHFLLGNIYRQSFKEMWEGEKRMKMLRWIEEEFDASKCRVNCRMDEVNRYLWELKHPPEHVNFI